MPAPCALARPNTARATPRPQDNTFHYQTDGWLSTRSAAVYETSTEALFFGRQDAMQRTSLLAIHEWLQETGK